VAHSGTSGHPFSASGDPLPLYRRLIAIATATGLGLAAMWAMLKVPARDPIDVVGMSLVLGYENYSEACEQRAYFAMIATSLIAAVGCSRLVSRQSGRWIRTCGLLLCWALLTVPLFLGWHWHLVTSLALLGMACALGALSGRLRMQREQIAYVSWLAAVGLWGVADELGSRNLRAPVVEFIVVFLPAAVALTFFQLLDPARLRPAWAGIGRITFAVLLLCSLAHHQSAREFSLLLSGVLAFAEFSLPSQRQFYATQFRVRPWWIAAALVAWSVLSSNPTTHSSDYGYLLAEAVSLGQLLTIGGYRGLSFHAGHRGDAARALISHPAAVAALALFGGVSQGWWFGLCLAATVMAANHARWRRRGKSLAAPVLALGLALATGPYLAQESVSLDPFHHGQILSAIWEFEQGGQLYTEVFPLRSTEFFVGWLSRMVLPPTLIGADALLHSLSPILQTAGGCLAAFAWTRSILCSVAVGLTVLCNFVGFREGLLLLILGLACEILRSHRRLWWSGLVPLSLPALFAGYDIMVPYLGGAAAALAFAEIPFTTFWRGLARGLAAAALMGCASVALFTLVVTLWQGPEAAQTYWQVFVDYSRHYTAFYGLPLNIEPRAGEAAIQGFVALAVFASLGAASWSHLPPQRQRLWAFLLVAATLFNLRGLGRSDNLHVISVVPIVAVLWCLVIWEGVWLMSRRRLGFSSRDVQYAGAALLVYSISHQPEPATPPWQFWSYLRTIPQDERIVMPPDPSLERLVGPADTLWAVDFGIANYAQKRRNPTRHALAYCIGSPAEQSRAVRDLRARPPRAVLWYWSQVDFADGLTRQYMLANHILRNYRPGGNTNYGVPIVVPAGASWPGLSEIPDEYLKTQELRRLPQVWGSSRWPRLADRVVKSQALPGWAPPSNVGFSAGTTDAWLLESGIVPKDWNYLVLEVLVPIATAADARWIEASLDFGNHEERDPLSKTTWHVLADGKRHAYLIPIGCHPAWTWRPRITHMQLTIPAGDMTSPPTATLYDIEEVD
jgi:hypothetical protein